MSSQTILIPGPLGIGDIVDRAFRIYRARFKLMLLTALAILVPIGLLSAGINYVFLSEAMNEASFDMGTGFVSSIGSLLVALITWLGQGLAELALTFHALATLRDVPLGRGEGISRAGGRIWSWLGMAILRGLAYAVMLSVVLLPTILIAVLVENNPDIGIAFCLLPFLMLAVVALVLYLQTRWVVGTPGLVVEELGARGALGRSWALTRGKFWRSFAVTFVLGLIALVVLSLPTFAIQMFAFGVSSDLPLPSAVGAFLSAVVGALFVPLTASAYLVLYYDLRVRHENLDLDQRVGQLEADLKADEERPA